MHLRHARKNTGETEKNWLQEKDARKQNEFCLIRRQREVWVQKRKKLRHEDSENDADEPTDTKKKCGGLGEESACRFPIHPRNTRDKHIRAHKRGDKRKDEVRHAKCGVVEVENFAGAKGVRKRSITKQGEYL